jgi:hypothetical protein
MTFEVVSERKLSQEELEIIREAERLLGKGHSRREIVMMLGIAGAVAVSPVLIRPAHAMVPLAIRALVGAVVLAAKVFHRGASVAATITLVNSGAAAARGPVALQHKAPSGLIEAQASAYVDVPPQSEKTLRHSGFTAKTIGDNEYIAQTGVNEEDEPFEVD